MPYVLISISILKNPKMDNLFMSKIKISKMKLKSKLKGFQN